MADVGAIVAGVLLLVFGGLLTLVGFVFFPLLCIGPALGVIGFILLIYGAVKEEPRPVYVNLPPSPTAAPAVYCPQCGSLLQWVPQYQRGFCPRCGVYR